MSILVGELEIEMIWVIFISFAIFVFQVTGLSCSEKHFMKIRQKVPGFYFRIFCKEFYSDFQSYSKDYECDSVFSLV